MAPSPKTSTKSGLTPFSISTTLLLLSLGQQLCPTTQRWCLKIKNQQSVSTHTMCPCVSKVMDQCESVLCVACARLHAA